MNNKETNFNDAEMASNIGLQTAGETEVISEESQIQHLCSQLGIPDNVMQQASHAWQQLKNSGTCDCQSEELTWFGCLLYITVVDTRLPYGLGDPLAHNGSLTPPCVTVTDLLKALNTNMLDFFRRLRSVKASRPLSDVAQYHLMALERKYLITWPLFHKFERVFESVFRAEESDTTLLSNGNTDSGPFLESNEERRKLAWTLFVYAKASTQTAPQELVATFHLLLCCLHYVLTLTPSFQLRSPFDAASTPGVNQGNHVDTLKELCSKFSANLEEVQTVWTTELQPILDSLPKAQGSIDMDQLGILYHNLYKQQGDIDELLFLQKDPHLVHHNKNRLSDITNNNQNVENTSPTEVTVENHIAPVTPVRAALGTVQQLRSLLQYTKDEPSSALLRYFQNCSVNPTIVITERLLTLQKSFVDQYLKVDRSSSEQLVRQRFKMATRLYYHVMENMIKQEEARLSQVDFSYLLNNDVFHRCLLSCAAEVVLVTYSRPWSSALSSPGAYSESSEDSRGFPWILNTFGVKAYDFLKVPESFIKAEPKLCREIVKHLQSTEARILERFAWERGSPVFDIYLEGDFQSTPSDQVILTPGGAANSAADLYLSPVRGRKNSRSVNRFFNKVCRLAYHRLQTLCSRLDIAKDLQQKIWTCLEYCIMHRPELMRDRHLDQILMCSIYAICKVMEKEVRFKTIVTEYRTLPHSSQPVYRCVVISRGETDTIIAFYNRVFMLSLKNYILQFSSNKTPTLSPLPKSPSTNLTASPVYKLPGKTNFFISPMKSSPFKPTVSPTQMTPRTRQLYSFGEVLGSAEKLRGINNAVSGLGSMRGQAPSSKGQKRLMFDQVDEAAPGMDESSEPPYVIVVKRKCNSQSRKCLQFSGPSSSSSQDS